MNVDDLWGGWWRWISHKIPKIVVCIYIFYTRRNPPYIDIFRFVLIISFLHCRLLCGRKFCMLSLDLLHTKTQEHNLITPFTANCCYFGDIIVIVNRRRDTRHDNDDDDENRIFYGCWMLSTRMNRESLFQKRERRWTQTISLIPDRITDKLRTRRRQEGEAGLDL